jgi:hypothetical protein
MERAHETEVSASMPPAFVSLPKAAGEQSSTVHRDSARHQTRSQPWRSHWPPQNAADLTIAYGFKKGEKIRIWGN